MVVGTVALLIAGGGCSSSSGGGSCGSVAGCGGNLVGTWKITSSCTSGSQGSPSTSCPGETINIDSSTVTGTFTFNSDGTYQSTLVSSATETVTFPASCVAMLGASLTCAQVAAQLNGAGTGGGLTESWTCQGSGGCNCNVDASITGSANGTYTTSGAALTTMPTGQSTAGSSSYCVQGSTLYMSAGSSMMGSMPSANLVATKQ
ncbi:MAG: hypothetical protein ACRENE_13260 [Polyangiaceae bacterium]